jgi:S1-C subfamily serine protease
MSNVSSTIQAVKYIVETLIRDGKIVRPVLGISYLESKQARALGIERGVLVLDVPPNSPAYKAGMRGTRRTESGTFFVLWGLRHDEESVLVWKLNRCIPFPPPRFLFTFLVGLIEI